MIQPFSARLPIGIGRGRPAYDFILQERGPESRRVKRLRLRYEREMLLSGWRFLTTSNPIYATYTAMTVANLQSLAIDTTDPYAGWQSARVSNVATLADNYEFIIDLSTAATAPANDSAVYVYVVPWVTTDGGTTWITGGNFGTTTLPSGTEGTASISDPNSMKGPISLPYKITSQRIEGWFLGSQFWGPTPPDGFSLAIRNNCGAALGTGCVVAYRAINETFT